MTRPIGTRLELAAVSKCFATRDVLRQVWLQVRSGEAVGLIGANGAGKTTMLRVAAGLVHPDEGAVRRSGCVPLSYFGGEATLPPDVRADRWARFFGAETAEHRPLGRLSRGTRQGLALQVLLSGPTPDLVLLDEPWEGLDPQAAAWLTGTIRRLTTDGAGVLVSSHRLHDLATACTRFVLLKDGRCHAIATPADGVREMSAATASGGRR